MACPPEVLQVVERAGLVAEVTAELEAWKARQCSDGDCCTHGRGCYSYTILTEPDCYLEEGFVGGRMFSVTLANQRFQDAGGSVSREVFVPDDGSAFTLEPSRTHRHLVAMHALSRAFAPTDGREVTEDYVWSASSGCTEVTPKPGSVFAGRVRLCGENATWLEGPETPPVRWSAARDAAVAEVARYPSFLLSNNAIDDDPARWSSAGGNASVVVTEGDRTWYLFRIDGHGTESLVVRIDVRTGAIGSAVDHLSGRADLAAAARDLDERPGPPGLLPTGTSFPCAGLGAAVAVIPLGRLRRRRTPPPG